MSVISVISMAKFGLFARAKLAKRKNTSFVSNDKVMNYAIEIQDADLIKLLYERKYNTAFAYAIEKQYLKMIALLREDQQVDPVVSENYVGSSTLEYKNQQQIFKHALQLQDEQLIQLLCNEDYNNVLIYAVDKRYVGMVSLLLKHPKVDPIVDNNAALYNSIVLRHQEIAIELFKDPRIDPMMHMNSYEFRSNLYSQTQVAEALLTSKQINAAKFSESSSIDYLCFLLQFRQLNAHQGELRNPLQYAFNLFPYAKEQEKSKTYATSEELSNLKLRFRNSSCNIC